MWNFIEIAFNIIETLLLFYLLAKRLGIRKGKKHLLFFGFVGFVLFVFVKDYLTLDIVLATPLIALIIFICSLWGFNGNVSLKLYWSLVAILVPILVQYVVFLIFRIFPIIDIEKVFESSYDRFVLLVSYIVVLFIVILIIANVRIKKLQNIYYSVPSRIFTVVLVILGIISGDYLTDILLTAKSHDIVELVNPITRFTVLYAVLLISMIVIVAILGILSKRDLDNKLQANRMSYQNSYVKAIESSYKTLRKQRHDMKDQISIMSILLSEKNYAELDEFFRQLDEKYNEIDIVMPTNNSAINACLSVKANEAKQNGIEFHCLANFSGTIPLPDIDSCTLLANLLNNAIEACLLVDKAYPRKIQVDIFEKNSMFGIRVANTYTGTYNMINGEFKTLKKSGDHGIGIPEMREIVEGHNGFIQFDAQEEWFTATAIIPMKGNANA